jgi:hypothetical protein
VGELLWGEWVHGDRDYMLKPEPVSSVVTIDETSGS